MAMTNISQIFQIEYPLPKADLLAVHEFVSIQQFSLARPDPPSVQHLNSSSTLTGF